MLAALIPTAQAAEPSHPELKPAVAEANKETAADVKPASVARSTEVR